MGERETSDVPDRHRRNIYGRIFGRALRPNRREALATRLQERMIQGVSVDDNPTRKMLTPASLAGTPGECWLEIGFGDGEHLLEVAQAHPDIAMIGCEFYRAGIASLLGKMPPGELQNLRIHPADARDLLDVIPDALLGRVFLLYPDPWPKNRHAKRRFVNPDNLAALARTMREGAELRIATDMAVFVRHALLGLLPHPAFVWAAKKKQDWQEPWPAWPGTKYERKAAAEGRRPIYLTFIRTGETKTWEKKTWETKT